MKNLAVVIAGGLLATVVVGAVFWMKIGDEHTQLDQLHARVTELEAAPPPVVAPVVTPAPAPVAPVAAPAAPVPPTAPPPRKQPAAAPTQNDLLAQTKEMMSGSAGRDMMRAMLQQQYPDVGKELGLSDAQASNLLDVLARQQAELSTESMALLGGGTLDAKTMQEMGSKMEEKERAHEAELTSLLGNKYQDFQQYQATAAAKQQVAQLQTALGSANALNENQSKALIAALAAAQKRMTAEQRNEPEMKGSSTQEILANQVKTAERHMHGMLEAASPHLTFAQQEIYKRQVEQQISMLGSIMGMMGGAPK